MPLSKYGFFSKNQGGAMLNFTRSSVVWNNVFCAFLTIQKIQRASEGADM